MAAGKNLPSSPTGGYKVGDKDYRPWGHYVITAAGMNDKGEEYCDKEITVLPGTVLSLHAHRQRRETWKVLKGTLTVLLNGELKELSEGGEAHIPVGGVHCMANLAEEGECVVLEREEGTCRDEDNTRYIDAYGRATDPLQGEVALHTATLYNEILTAIREG